MESGAGMQVYADLVNLGHYGSLFVQSIPGERRCSWTGITRGHRR